MSNEWDDHASDWDTNANVVLYSEKAFESLGRVVSLDGRRVLDFGCGTGLLTGKIAGLAESVVGLDTSSDMLAVLRDKKLPNVAVLEEEMSRHLVENHPALRPGFDLIVASSVCSFLPEFEETLLLLKSLLVRGGLFVQWDWLATEGEMDFGLTMEQVEHAYRQTELESVSLSPSFSLEMDDGQMSVLMGVGRNA